MSLSRAMPPPAGTAPVPAAETPLGPGTATADTAAGETLCSLSPLAGCCWLTHCSLTGHSSQVHLQLSSSHSNATELFLLAFAWFPELGQSGQFQLVSGPKDLFPFAFAIWRHQEKATACTDMTWVPGRCTC